MAAVDPTFGINDFNKPKVLTEAETYVKMKSSRKEFPLWFIRRTQLVS